MTDAARGQGGDHLSIGSLIDYVISFGPTVPRDIDVYFQATLKKIARQCLIPWYSIICELFTLTDVSLLHFVPPTQLEPWKSMGYSR